MGKIKHLNEDLIKKIAAGQVIERPASVVKELIENSIDSECSNIKIEIEDGGSTYIKVTDDGVGMDEDDIFLSFKQHTTSKIFSEDDFLSIQTLGFRGEALYSISNVSNTTVKSKSKDNIAGSFIKIENGEILDSGSMGLPQGTSIIVENLFQSIPARKKFLKSTKTELRYILDVIIPYCIAFPNIGFFVSHNKRILFDLPSMQSVTERIGDLLGSDVMSHLLPVSFEDVHFKISGFVTKPQLGSPNKNKQYLFVNRRYVTSPIISDAVKDSFGTLLPPRMFPPFVLFIDLPPSLVDVNVHPRKEKVAFTDDKYIYDLFYKSVNDVFAKEELIYKKEDKDTDFSTVVMEELEDYKIDHPILQVHNLYLIKQLKDGILLVDQHAAHERILYEKFLDSYSKGYFDGKISPSNSIVLNFSLSDSQVIEDNLDIIESFGIKLDPFGKNTYKVAIYPQLLREDNLKDFVEEILTTIKDGKSFKTLNTHVKYVLSTMACKSAIKSGDFLSEEERKKLLEDLEKTKTKYTCPHGRPVKMEITMNELARMFKRK